MSKNSTQFVHLASVPPARLRRYDTRRERRDRIVSDDGKRRKGTESDVNGKRTVHEEEINLQVTSDPFSACRFLRWSFHRLITSYILPSHFLSLREPYGGGERRGNEMRPDEPTTYGERSVR